MGAVEEVKRGRPPGTTESVESLSRREAQQTIKTVERMRRTLEEQIEIVSEELVKLPRNLATMKDRIEMATFIDTCRDGLLRSIPPLVKISQTDPSKTVDGGENDEGMKELMAQIKGDIV